MAQGGEYNDVGYAEENNFLTPDFSFFLQRLEQELLERLCDLLELL